MAYIFLGNKLKCVAGGIYSWVWRGCSDRADHHHRPHSLFNSSMQTETAGATPEVCSYRLYRLGVTVCNPWLVLTCYV